MSTGPMDVIFRTTAWGDKVAVATCNGAAPLSVIVKAPSFWAKTKPSTAPRRPLGAAAFGAIEALENTMTGVLELLTAMVADGAF